VGGVRFRDLVTLGLSGGIVPCPAGFTIMLVAAHYQKLTLGLIYLTFFSLGLGALLCAIGVVLVLGKERLLDRLGSRSETLLRWLPVASALLVACIGLYFMYDSYAMGKAEIGQMLRALAGVLEG
jgi:nickel/cobalt exporter